MRVRLNKEAELVDERAQQATADASRSQERAKGVGSVAQVVGPSLRQMAAAELAALSPEQQQSLVAKVEQLLIAAARKFDQQAAELRGRATAHTEHAASLRKLAAAKAPALKKPAKPRARGTT